ncbi:DegV family protein [soil metagenome]
MNLAIVTDSTCDLKEAELAVLDVQRVPLYVNFKGELFKDWVEINPADIVKGVAEGAALPSTSQPSPQDFENAFQAAASRGADQVLCLTISGELSGTVQSANLAKAEVDVPVTVFDSRTASVALGDMVKEAARLRDQGASLDEIMRALEHIRDTNFILFTVASLDFLQKNGRIGGAQALLGSLLNIKPLLTVVDGKVQPAGRVRGTKKAVKELVDQTVRYAKEHGGRLNIVFLHIQDVEAAKTLQRAVHDAGVVFEDGGIYEIGAVIATHVGPGTFGLYMSTKPQA